MKTRFLVPALLAATVAWAGEVDPSLPESWQAFPGGGPDGLPGRCEVGVDPAHAEKNMTVKCASAVPSHGGLYQSLYAGNFRGQRVRYSALVRAEDIEDVGNATGSGGLWIRVDGPDVLQALVIDNMRDRAFTGTVDWTPAEIVIDIPENATRINFGFWMQGRGQIWISAMKFEDSIPATVGVTAGPRVPQDTGFPRNLQ